MGIDGVMSGKAVRLDSDADGVSVHPDGRRVAFQSAASVNGSGTRQEVWVLENILPRDPKKK